MDVIDDDYENASIANLIELALTTYPDDEAGEYNESDKAIYELYKRGSRDVFEAAKALLESADTHVRQVGIRILGQLDWANGYTFREEVFPLLLALLEHDPDPDVLHGVCVALGHLSDPRAVEPMAHLKNHPDDLVRYGVVIGLLRQEDDLAVQTLIELSADVDVDVRDWATFGLGTQIDWDTPAIREALVARLIDPEGMPRAEAMTGLAKRKDERVIQPLINEFMSGDVGNMQLEAATEFADSRLLPSLLHLKALWSTDEPYRFDGELDEAITACGGS